MYYAIRVNDDQVKTVNGRKLVLSEYPEFSLFHYRAQSSGYFVCETTTGMFLAWAKKLKNAKKEAVNRINYLGVKEFKLLIKERLLKHGKVNREIKL